LAFESLEGRQVLSASLKNVILMIGDGMGFGHVQAAQNYAGHSLSFQSFPYQGELTTADASGGVPDSAAAGTAMATGRKVNSGVISQAYPGNGSDLLTSLEFHKALGRATGLVSTGFMTDATPAAFGAHEPSRGNTSQIATDYMTGSHPNVLLGGGANGMSFSAALAGGYTVIPNQPNQPRDLASVNAAATTFLCGQFGGGNSPYEYDGVGSFPHLSEMTVKALDILDNNTSGFFLMVESANIDHASHSSDLGRCVPEVLEFANAVQTVVNWSAGRDDTLIVVTADHNTGGLKVTKDNGPGVLPTVTWTSAGSHSLANVPIYATGTNASLVRGILDNTRVFQIATSYNPVPRMMLPLDNGPGDTNSAVDHVTVGMVQSAFAVQLSDLHGINDSTVSSADVVLTCNGATLTEGVDYFFSYDAARDAATLRGTSVFGNGTYGLQILSNSIQDGQGNWIEARSFEVVIQGTDSNTFTIVVLPDTQYYSKTYPQYFNEQTQWIANNIGAKNLVFVTQVGDIVDDAGAAQQWTNADHAMDLLDGDMGQNPDGLIPYGVSMGNHEYSPKNTHAAGTAAGFLANFGPGRYAGRNWYGGASGDPGIEGLNHFQVFDACGFTFLNISLEWYARQASIDWANRIIQAHPGLPVILTTHEYLNGSSHDTSNAPDTTSNYHTGQGIYDELVKPNPQVFMVLCGHWGVASAQSTDDAGKTVYEMMADYQGLSNGGNGYLRLLKFMPGQNRVDVSTYSTHSGVAELTDGSNKFSLSINFTQRFNLAPTYIAPASASASENQPAGTAVATLSTTDPNSGDTFTYSLVAGDGDTNNGFFGIAGNLLKTTAPFDFETKSAYTVRVRSTDQTGLWIERQITINVTNVNEMPVANAGGPYAIEAGSSLSLDASASSDPDASSGDRIVSYAWDLNGDGQYADLVSAAATVTVPYAQTASLGVGIHTIGLQVADIFGLTGTATTTMTIRDTTPPLISGVPANLTLEATGPAGALATWPAPAATDLVDGTTAVTPSSASGSIFPLGTTTVTLSTVDGHGNAATATFTVTVRDTTPPKISLLVYMPFEATGPHGTVVDYAALVTDAVDPHPTVTYTRASGSVFCLGMTIVDITATDASGNTSTATFNIYVVDTTPPMLSLPPDQTFHATNPAGALVHFTEATATDLVSQTLVTYAIGSDPITNDHQFPIGSTVVTATARDGAGNSSSGQFRVTVSNAAPVASAGGPYRIGAGYDLRLDGTGSSDPDGDALSYAWDLDGDGLYDDAATADPTIPYVTLQALDWSLGPHTVSLQVTDALGSTATASTTVELASPATVTSIVINDGGVQRSMITSISVTFSQAMTIGPGAFEIMKTGTGGGAVAVAVAPSDVQGRTVATLTFSGALVEYGSLKDGSYQLTVRGEKVRDRVFGVALDGDNDQQPSGDRLFGATAADKFFRKYGDGDGSGLLDATDYYSLLTTNNKRSTEPGYVWYFDFDANGVVDSSDLAQFRARYPQRVLPPPVASPYR
jgi:alkaline phosphatase